MPTSRPDHQARSASRLALCGGGAFLALTLALFAFYDKPFAQRSAGPITIALAPIGH